MKDRRFWTSWWILQLTVFSSKAMFGFFFMCFSYALIRFLDHRWWLSFRNNDCGDTVTDALFPSLNTGGKVECNKLSTATWCFISREDLADASGFSYKYIRDVEWEIYMEPLSQYKMVAWELKLTFLAPKYVRNTPRPELTMLDGRTSVWNSCNFPNKNGYFSWWSFSLARSVQH